MRILLALIALPLMAPTASAADLTISSRGLGAPRVWVDGVAHGKVKKREPLTIQVSPGPHEIVATYQDSPDNIHCVGVVDVTGSEASVLVRNMGCEGIRDGIGPEGATIIQGLLRVRDNTDLTMSMSIDGARGSRVGADTLFNIPAGRHILTFTHRLDDSRVDLPVCNTTVMVPSDAEVLVIPSPAGCLTTEPTVQIRLDNGQVLEVVQ